MTLYSYVVSLFEGVDLDRYDFLVPLIMTIIIVLSLGVTYRALLTIFNSFFRR